MASLKTIQKALTLPYRWGVSNPRSLANFLWWSLLPVTPALLSMAFMTAFSMVQKSAHHSKVKESRCAIYFIFFNICWDLLSQYSTRDLWKWHFPDTFWRDRYTILFLSILDIIQERRNVNLPVYIKSICRPDQLFMTPNHWGIFLKLFLETLMFPSFTSFSRVSNSLLNLLFESPNTSTDHR